VCPAVGGEGGDCVEKMSCVGGGAHAAGEDEIVTGAFALDADAPGGEPGEGVEPVERAGDLSEELNEDVSAFEVGEFVKEYGFELFGIPVAGGLGEEEARFENSEDERDGFVRVEEEDYGAAEVKLELCGFEG